MSKKTYENKAACAVCGEVIISHYRHEWVSCSCGSIYVDGGNEYWRGGGEPENFIRMWDILNDIILLVLNVSDTAFDCTDYGWIG